MLLWSLSCWNTMILTMCIGSLTSDFSSIYKQTSTDICKFSLNILYYKVQI